MPIFIISYLPLEGQETFRAYQKREFLTENNDRLPYRILLPIDYDCSKKYPLLVFLHGSGERGNDNETQLKHGASLFLQTEIRKNFQAIVVFPNVPKVKVGLIWNQILREDGIFLLLNCQTNR